MKTSKQLKEERASLITEQDALVKTAKAETRDFNETEETRFDDLQTKIDAFDTQIARSIKVEEAEARAASVAGTPVVDTEQRERENLKKRYSIHKVIRTQMGMEALDGAYK